MATHTPVPPLKGLQEEIEIAKSIRAETLAFVEDLMPGELDRQDLLAIAYCVFRTNVTGDFGIVTEDSGPS